MRHIGQKLAKSPLKVGKARIFDILSEPVVTEKSTLISQSNQYTFKVPVDAAKPEIKQAVEEIFKVKVRKVNTILSKGKQTTRRFKGQPGKRNDVKKAIVTLEQGQNIDVAAGL